MSARVRLFVYGTLLAGEPHHPFLAGALPLGAARTVTGYRLHDLGPFPAMVEAGSGAVVGELYEVSAGAIARLDRLEGVPHLCRRAVLMLGTGDLAQAYVMDPERIARRPVVEGGSWRERTTYRYTLSNSPSLSSKRSTTSAGPATVASPPRPSTTPNR